MGLNCKCPTSFLYDQTREFLTIILGISTIPHRTVASIDSEIARVQDALVRAKARYDAIASNLEELMEKKKEQQARVIMDAFIKSGKSYEEIMNFLNVDGK